MLCLEVNLKQEVMSNNMVFTFFFLHTRFKQNVIFSIETCQLDLIKYYIQVHSTLNLLALYRIRELNWLFVLIWLIFVSIHRMDNDDYHKFDCIY